MNVLMMVSLWGTTRKQKLSMVAKNVVVCEDKSHVPVWVIHLCHLPQCKGLVPMSMFL